MANFVDLRIWKTANLIGEKKKNYPRLTSVHSAHILMTPSSLYLQVAKLDSHVYIHVQTKMLEVFTAILVPEQYCYTSNVVHKCFNNMVTGSEHS